MTSVLSSAGREVIRFISRRTICIDPQLRPYLTTEDPDAFLMVDTDFYEDTTYYYQLYLETQAGKLYESNVDYIYIPRTGVHELSLRAGSQIGDIVVDPMRDRLYVSDTQHNAVWVISTLGDSQGGALIDHIPVGARPGGLALSSDRLYVANSGNHTVTDLDTATYLTSPLLYKGFESRAA